MKHIDIQHHYIREVLEEGKVTLTYCPTEEMCADFLTKELGATKHNKCCHSAGLRAAEVSSWRGGVGILISTPPIPSSSTYSLLSYTYSLPINLYFFVNSRLTYSHKYLLFTTHTSSHTSLHSKVLVDISLLTSLNHVNSHLLLSYLLPVAAKGHWRQSLHMLKFRSLSSTWFASFTPRNRASTLWNYPPTKCLSFRHHLLAWFAKLDQSTYFVFSPL